MHIPRSVGAAALGAWLALFAAGCDRSVPIGVVLSESGVASVYGEKVKRGVELALREVNAAGGYRGRRFELLYRDDATNPAVARRVVEELIRERDVRIVIGPIVSSVALAIAPICEEHHAILLSPTASAPQITDAGEFVFRNYPSDVLEGTSMARFAKELGLERIVILAVDNSFGAGLEAVFRQQYTSKLRQVVRTFHFEEADEASFEPMIRQVRELAPDGIYLVAYLGDADDLLRAIRAAGIGAVVLGASSMTEDIARLSGTAAENLVFPQPTFDSSSPEPAARSFVEAYRRAYGEDPEMFAAHGYDALKLVLEAMERGGSPRAEDVKRGLLGIENYAGASGNLSFDDNGDVVQYPRLFVIRQGKAMQYDRFVEQGGTILPDGHR